jgi:hypothetical protein
VKLILMPAADIVVVLVLGIGGLLFMRGVGSH